MIDTSCLGLRQDDPAGAKFQTFTVPPAHDGWSYIVDDWGLAYDRTRFWPFREDDPAKEAAAVERLTKQLRREGQDWVLGEGCGWAPVRIAPDCHYGCGGHGNIVIVWPDHHEARKASADLHLYVRPQGLGAVILNCTLFLDLTAMTGAVTTWPIGDSPVADDGFSEDFPAALKPQAAERRDKILTFLAAEMARRDNGHRKIITAYDRWVRKEIPG